MYRPEGYSIDVDALHFEGDIIGQERDSFDSWGVSYDRVPGADEGFEADSGFDEMAVSDDNEPLVGLGLDPETADEVGKSFEEPIKNRQQNKPNNQEHNVPDNRNEMTRWFIKQRRQEIAHSMCEVV